MISSLLATIGLPALISILGETLSKIDHPIAKGAVGALYEMETLLKTGNVSPEQLSELNRHAESLAQLQSEEYRSQIAEINQSLRAEIASNDPYVRRMRPTFGYLMAFTWAAQMLALAWVMIEDPTQAPLLMQGFESLGLIWTVGLSVLGIYVYKRSEDKKIFAVPPFKQSAQDQVIEATPVKSTPEPHPALYNE